MSKAAITVALAVLLLAASRPAAAQNASELISQCQQTFQSGQDLNISFAGIGNPNNQDAGTRATYDRCMQEVTGRTGTNLIIPNDTGVWSAFRDNSDANIGGDVGMGSQVLRDCAASAAQFGRRINIVTFSGGASTLNAVLTGMSAEQREAIRGTLNSVNIVAPGLSTDRIHFLENWSTGVITNILASNWDRVIAEKTFNQFNRINETPAPSHVTRVNTTAYFHSCRNHVEEAQQAGRTWPRPPQGGGPPEPPPCVPSTSCWNEGASCGSVWTGCAWETCGPQCDVCGNGILEAGESCEWNGDCPEGAECTVNCQCASVETGGPELCWQWCYWDQWGSCGSCEQTCNGYSGCSTGCDYWSGNCWEDYYYN